MGKKVVKNRLDPEDFENAYREIHMVYERIANIVFNEKRGHAGTDVEASLATVESDLASAMEQLEFIRKKCGGR